MSAIDEGHVTHEEMKESIERLLKREYPNENAKVEEISEGMSELVYVERSSDALHAVRIEDDYSSCIFDLDAGIHVAQDMPANYRWIALPLDAFRDGEEEYDGVMDQQCRSRGVGIITVQQRGRGWAAKVIFEPKPVEGSFVSNYPNIDIPDTPDIPEGWRVVNV